MLPSLLAHEIHEGLKNFIVTGFETPTPFFNGIFTRFVQEPGIFCKGPYLSLNLPFLPGTIGRDYFSGFKTIHPPHAHQQKAWDRLRSDRTPQPTLVATGTGSGKTECFLYPLLDHCQRNPGPGIKAIVIYPMNALATDQAKRFAEVVFSRSSLKGKIRVGLFVGESEKSPRKVMGHDAVITDKQILRENPPDILLTNYKMLDYLLMRPMDRPLWRFNEPNTLRYLVVDELHTFDGAQGTDLACLIRRLKARLKTSRELLIPVGTSATLGSGEESEELLAYAGKIFQADFSKDSVIGEERQDRNAFRGDLTIDYQFFPPEDVAERLQPENHAGIPDYIRAQFSLLFSEEPPADISDPQWRRSLGKKLKQHVLFANLLQLLVQQPRSLEGLATEIGKALPPAARGHSQALLDSLCALVAYARDPDKASLPLVQLRLQFWVRELRRMVSRVSSDPMEAKLSFADDLRNEKDRLALPVVQCHDCHAAAWLGLKPSGQSKVSADLRAIYNAFFAHHPEAVMLVPLLEGEALPASAGKLAWLCAACGQLQSVGGHCQACGGEETVRVYEVDDRRTRRRHGQNFLVSGHDCPACGARSNMMVFGASAATLSSVAIHHNYASVFNDDKKLIAFSDSVQDAAHRAGFFTARTWRNTVRMAMAQALSHGGRMPLKDFYAFFPAYWRDKGLNPKALDDIGFVSHFIAPNMLWFNDYRHLLDTGRLPETGSLMRDVCRRLQWEVLAEFGYRGRLGRTLERIGLGAMGIEREPLKKVADQMVTPLREELGLRDVSGKEVERFIVGLLLQMCRRGAIWDRILETFVVRGGRTFAFRQFNFLPTFAAQTSAPIFLAARNGVGEFDSLTSNRGKTWCQQWVTRLFGQNRLLPDGIETDLCRLVVDALEKEKVLRSLAVKGCPVWGIEPDMLYLSADVVSLETPQGRSRVTVPKEMVDILEDLPAFDRADPGRFAVVADRDHWLAGLYLTGEVQRVHGHEHTGLLDRDLRERVEREFMDGGRPWYPNLLSATPTLEMGIDIGNLSSVLLCSVPPSQANYLQRIGRSGRRDGNALSLAMANGTPHDLYFYAEPLQMMAGTVEPPGVFLNAAAVVERQLTAYCMDRWVAGGIDPSAIPVALRHVLDAVEVGDLKKFPYNFIDFVKCGGPELLADFLDLFDDDFSARTLESLHDFLLGSADGQGLEMRIVRRLHELREERKSLRRRIDALKRRLDRLKKQPQDEAVQLEMDSIHQERSGLQAVQRSINARQTLNFFTDEGLLPNYAFPEEGVTLRSVIWWKKENPDEEGNRFEHVTYEYERPGATAISEMAPESVFYAGMRRVKITQVDLNLSEIEEWRFCPECSHAQNLATGDEDPVCPRCGAAMWADGGQKRQMVRLRQVMANSSDRDSRIGDDSDAREPSFYNRQTLADFSPGDIVEAYRVRSDALPFGFEFIRKVTFREMNFGCYSGEGEESSIAGVRNVRPGFRLCRFCGTVQTKRGEQEHSHICRAKDAQDEKNILECLYLYRDFTSEAIRILLPISVVQGADRYLNSFIAAIQLGLRRKFGGKVDHLRMLAYDEPLKDSEAKRHYLMLYDTVPGGTGYLDELMRSTRILLDVFRLARDTMAGCACNRDADKDGCYACLFAYRNSYGMESTSRDTAVALLSDILNAEDQFEQVKSISEIEINPIFDSELEGRFVEALRRAGLQGYEVQVQPQVVAGKPGYYLRVGSEDYVIEPQVDIGPRDGVQFVCRPDFLISSARSSKAFLPVAVFLDGFRYHKNRATDDSAKRLALVQSGRYRQWSLTWHDINLHFSKSAQQTRNPFCEALRPEMLPIQERLSQEFGIEGLGKCAVKPALEQLLAYLADPVDESWRAVAFVRCLGWFDQAAMRTETTRAAFAAAFPPLACVRLQDQFSECPREMAFGGLAWDKAEALLRVQCALPLSAIAAKDARHLLVNVILGEPGEDEALFQSAWQGFLTAYNLLQFLPAAGFTTIEGSRTGIYESIAWNYADRAFGRMREAPPQSGRILEELLQEALEETHAGLRILVDRKLPLPTLGYELLNAEGEIVAEAELAWEDVKIAGLLAEQAKGARCFTERDWQTIEIDEDGQWVNRFVMMKEGDRNA